MAGRPVPAESTRASRCDALVPPSPPPLTWMRPVPRSARTPPSAPPSASLPPPAGGRRAPGAGRPRGGARRPGGGGADPGPPRLHRLADQPLHGRELLRRRLGALRCRLAHHIAANAGMADQGPDIDAALLAQRV